ncbi:hypothetical protein DWF04_021655 [Cereibacter sphaeroides f. sp. denitrificans]
MGVTWPGTARRTSVRSGVKGAACTIRPPVTKSKLAWSMYMSSIGWAERFSTAISTAISASSAWSRTRGVAR